MLFLNPLSAIPFIELEGISDPEIIAIPKPAMLSRESLRTALVVGGSYQEL